MTATVNSTGEESNPRERLMINTLSGEAVTINEYLRRLCDGSEPEPTPERTAEAWARRHAPEGATEAEIARLAEARLPRQILLADLGDAIADGIIERRKCS